MRKRYHEEDTFVVGSIGRLCKVKNQGYLLEIFAEVLRIQPKSCLLLIGQGEMERELMCLSDSMGIKDRIIHIASTDKVNDFFDMMDVFILPSLSEGLPIVGVEAQASGLPCIFSDSITRQVSITDRAYFLNLRRTASEWAQTAVMVAQKGTGKRSEYANYVREAGYEIKDTAKWMQEFYMGL